MASAAAVNQSSRGPGVTVSDERPRAGRGPEPVLRRADAGRRRRCPTAARRRRAADGGPEPGQQVGRPAARAPARRRCHRPRRRRSADPSEPAPTSSTAPPRRSTGSAMATGRAVHRARAPARRSPRRRRPPRLGRRRPSASSPVPAGRARLPTSRLASASAARSSAPDRGHAEVRVARPPLVLHGGRAPRPGHHQHAPPRPSAVTAPTATKRTSVPGASRAGSGRVRIPQHGVGPADQVPATG